MADSDESGDRNGSAVPTGRITRLARFGGLATGVAGGVLVDGAKSIARGERPELSELLLTPGNATRVADQLSKLRGAAMKVGQLLSMDGGDMIPPELAEILARLRASGEPMPGRQLRRVLADNWGRAWLSKFKRFDVQPMAAASIGQVHRAVTKDGRDLAVKIQYPGVRECIDSDVDNVATLVRLSGLGPKDLDLTDFLSEAKAQLHEEADYVREGKYLARFGELLGGDPNFAVPGFHEDLTTKDILAMDFAPGVPIETIADAPQETRDRIVLQMMKLFVRELFDFGLIQTDPNFANYRYRAEDDRIVLLDFGASRDVSEQLQKAYLEVMARAVDGTRAELREACIGIGFVREDLNAAHDKAVMDIIEVSMEPFRIKGPFDFATSDIPMRMRDISINFEGRREVRYIPPTETLFIQRKIAGLFLLGTRLKARVDMAEVVTPYLNNSAR